MKPRPALPARSLAGPLHSGGRSRLRGVVYLEVLLALLPLLLTFLGITQLALLKIGALVVQHAATRAARAALVVLDDDPKHYNGAPRGDLNAGAPANKNGVLSLAPKLNRAYSKLAQDEVPAGGARLGAIRSAAYHPLAILSPGTLGHSTLGDEFGSSPWARVLIGRLVYVKGATSLTLHPQGSEKVLSEVGAHEPVTLKLAFLMPCGVPLVSALMCTSALDIGKARLGLPSSESAQGIAQDLENTASPLVRDATLALGGRFLVLKAESTFIAQGADYHKAKK